MVQGFSQRHLISQYIHRYLASDVNRSELIDPVVKDSLADLVRIQMRRVAADQVEIELGWKTILETAVSQTLSELTDAVGSDLESLQRYFPLIRNGLEYTAKEVSQLQKAHITHQSRNQATIQQRNNKSAMFEITVIGSANNVQKLVALSTSSYQSINIDLELIRRVGVVNGDWFPYEIRVEEIDFVLDDDGSIHVSTENFPDHMIQSSYENMRKIAEIIYER